jgi:tetratricopeptide (TPR) repeat protein
MSRNDWYRQTDWSDESRERFFAKLARSRGAFHRAQYLRIQALSLAETGEVDKIRAALDLLGKIFTEYPEEFDVPMAHLQAAQCHDALGDVEAAGEHFERAMAELTTRPNLDIGLAHEYPWFIVRRGLVAKYDRALEVLTAASSVFPYQRFQESASRAFIAAHRGEVAAARASAQAALDAASAQESPFSRHPAVGLIGDRHREWLGRLQALVSA